MELARVGARTTPLDPRFAPRIGAGLPGRAAATRVLVTSRRGGGGAVAIEAGASMGALNEAIVAFESVAAPPTTDEGGRPLVDPGLYHPTILPDGTVLPPGMTIGHRTMQVRYLKRMLKTLVAKRGKLLLAHGRLYRVFVGLSLALTGARDSLRIAILNRAEPGRIQWLMGRVAQLEGQVSKLMREMSDIMTLVGTITVQIDEMTAELLTFGETI